MAGSATAHVAPATSSIVTVEATSGTIVHSVQVVVVQ